TRRRNHVVVAADEADIAFAVALALIARRHPVADELVACCVRPLPVFEKHHGIGALHRDLAELAGLASAAVIANDRDGVPRHRLSDRARLRDADLGAVREHEVAFGLAVEFVDGETQSLAAPAVSLFAERLAAGAD